MSHAALPSPDERPRTPRRPAFTLLELLVTIGAVAVVAVGLAAVFGAVGDAVATGRRVSRMTQYSRMIEAQLRKDFSSMTRDGFLAIRQQYADRNGDGVFTLADDRVRVGEADTTPRPRRVDEIIFFAHGDYVSDRPPLPDGNWVARSDTAMIYYGHGERVNPDLDNAISSKPYAEPKVNWAKDATALNNADNLGRAGGFNRFAGKWTLLRQATLLKPVPAMSSAPAFSIFGLPLNSPLLRDKDNQIAGQPAAASVFRAINSARGVGEPSADVVSNPPINEYLWYVTNTQTPNAQANYTGTAFHSPMLTSGTVDIATTSLEEIKQRLLGSGNGFLPRDYNPAGLPPTSVSSTLAPATNARQSPPGEVDVLQAWMDNAFPAPSAQIDDQLWGTAYPSAGQYVKEVVPGSRIRCEERAVDVLEAIGGVGTTAPQRREGAMTRADRLMLPMHNLAPACSEFIIEWSFGQMDNTGATVWHGLVSPSVAASATSNPRPYDDTPIASGGKAPLVYRIPFRGPFRNATEPREGTYTVPERLIYGRQIVEANPPVPNDDILTLTSYFGQVDPVFNPDHADTNTVFDTTTAGNGLYPFQSDDANRRDAAPFSSGSLRPEWPWPTLIRVRVTLVDPVDPKPETEQTFEYVFQVPSRDGT